MQNMSLNQLTISHKLNSTLDSTCTCATAERERRERERERITSESRRQTDRLLHQCTCWMNNGSALRLKSTQTKYTHSNTLVPSGSLHHQLSSSLSMSLRPAALWIEPATSCPLYFQLQQQQPSPDPSSKLVVARLRAQFFIYNSSSYCSPSARLLARSLCLRSLPSDSMRPNPL